MKKKLIAVAAAAVAIVPVAASPASATATGEVAFTCTAHLPDFPTSGAQGTCDGTASIAGLPSAGVGGLAGLSNSLDPYVLVTAPGARGNFSATFDYQEPCVAAGPPPAGLANGRATITALTGVKDGVTVTATATVRFQWVRAGTEAAILITGGSIEFSDNESATITAGAGTAAFIPVAQAHNICGRGGSMDALVAGTATIAA